MNVSASNSPSANGSRSASPRTNVIRPASAGSSRSRARAAREHRLALVEADDLAAAAADQRERHHPGPRRDVEHALAGTRIDRRDQCPAPARILAEAQHGAHPVVLRAAGRRTARARGACEPTLPPRGSVSVPLIPDIFYHSHVVDVRRRSRRCSTTAATISQSKGSHEVNSLCPFGRGARRVRRRNRLLRSRSAGCCPRRRDRRAAPTCRRTWCRISRASRTHRPEPEEPVGHGGRAGHADLGLGQPRRRGNAL